MTLSATYEPRRQQGNGVTKEFSYSFDPYSLEALKVYIEENGVQTETQDYTATADENGGIVTFNVAPTSEQYVVIARSVPQDQEVPFYTSSGFDAGVVENSLDKLTAMVQEVNNEAVRSAKLPKGYNINLELPVPESGKGLYWNNEGTGFQNSRLNLDDVETLTKSYRDQSLASRDEAVASSTKAVNTVKEATDLLANTQTYVDEAVVTINSTATLAKSDIEDTRDSTIEVVTSTSASAVATIEQTVAGGKQEINTTIEEAQTSLSDTIAQAVEDVKAEATKAAGDAIQNAADEATQVALNQTVAYVENTAIPAISAVKDSAVSELENVLAADKSTLDGYVSSATNQASIASSKASEAAESARVAGEKVNQIDGVVNEVNAAAASASASAVRSENSAVRAEEAEQRIMESGALPSQSGNAGKYLTTDGTNASWADVGGGLEIGDIGFAPLGIDEAQNKRRYLNGQVISQSQFVSFTNKIKSAIELYPSLATTETNWQAEVTNSINGTCGKFVINDDTGTIRLPKYPDYVSKEYLEVAVRGNGMALGLTDGTNETALAGYRSSGAGDRLTINNSLQGSVVGTSNSNVALNSVSYGITTNPTKSGMIADFENATTEKIACKWFIQVATGVEETVDVTREIELNNPFSLLDYKWSEYELNNASWLISNGSFHSGTVYKAVYELLLKIHNGTETKDGVIVKLSTEAYEDTDFVLNTSNATFRLPIKVKLASGNAVCGNGMTLGLTDGNLNYGLVSNPLQSNQRFTAATEAYGKNTGTTGITPNAAQQSYGVTTDPTKSGIETSSSGLKLYFYVGETIQDANVINASGVLTRVANSIDRTVASDRETVVGWGIPDYSAGVSKSANTEYTADVSGWIYASGSPASGQSLTITIDGTPVVFGVQLNVSDSLFIPINRGSKYSITNLNYFTATFFPCKGVN